MSRNQGACDSLLLLHFAEVVLVAVASVGVTTKHSRETFLLSVNEPASVLGCVPLDLSCSHHRDGVSKCQCLRQQNAFTIGSICAESHPSIPHSSTQTAVLETGSPHACNKFIESRNRRHVARGSTKRLSVGTRGPVFGTNAFIRGRPVERRRRDCAAT